MGKTFVFKVSARASNLMLCLELPANKLGRRNMLNPLTDCRSFKPLVQPTFEKHEVV